MSGKRASVIVPIQVKKGFEIYLENLRFAMEALARQNKEALAGIELVLVDYESDGSYISALKVLCRKFGFAYARVMVDRDSEVYQRHGAIWNRGAALNAGVGVSSKKSEFVLFVDADCVVPRGYVAAHVRAIGGGGTIATYALVHDMRKGLEKHGNHEMLVNECGKLDNLRRAGFSHVCIPRSWFVENGGFDARYFGWGAEDDDLWLRIQASGIRKVALDGVTPIHLWHPQWEELIGRIKGAKFGHALVARNRTMFRYGKTVRYGMISIDVPGSVNLGNRLIEWSLKKALLLGEPAVTVSMFKVPTDEDILRLNGCKFVLLPGSTILADAKGNSDALVALRRIKVPVFCVAASGWGPKHRPRIDALGFISGPVGCRDPQICEVCLASGKDAMLVGCPTAYVEPRVTVPTVPYSIIGFGRDCMQWQVKALAALPGKLVAALQEANYEGMFALQVTGHVFGYNNPGDVIRHYAEADFVATGRLHGVLPAMSQRKPVYFFGDPADTRFTLLDYLGVPIHPMAGIISRDAATTASVYRNQLLELRNNLLEWKSRTIDRTWS